MATDISLEKILPSNLEAERSILGAVLLDDKAIHTVLGTLRKEDFYLESHRKIFEHMVSLTVNSYRDNGLKLQNWNPVFMLSSFS